MFYAIHLIRDSFAPESFTCSNTNPDLYNIYVFAYKIFLLSDNEINL